MLPSNDFFGIPELRQRFSRFVSLKDALSCVQVCKAWTLDFAAVIWYKVDLKTQPRFERLSSEIVSKHGHLIRIVICSNSTKTVALLANMAVNNLENLNIMTTIQTSHNVRVFEIIHRNISRLKSIELLPDYSDANCDTSPHYVNAASFVPLPEGQRVINSKLTNLKLGEVCLTQDGLVLILQTSPCLSDIKLINTNIIGAVTNQVFKHTNVVSFSGYVETIFPKNDLSLLSYFPNLRYLAAWLRSAKTVIPTAKAKNDIAKFCPKLTEYGLEGSGAYISHFCSRIIKNPHLVIFDYRAITSEVITSILLHHATLKKLVCYAIQSKRIFNAQVQVVPRPELEFSHYLQLIPRVCSKLEELDLHFCEMDINDIEEGEWICTNLKKLSFRVKGLDTKKKIEKTFKLWKAGRLAKLSIDPVTLEKEIKESEGDTTMEQNTLEDPDALIEARVARHLLKFENLRMIWLGLENGWFWHYNN